MAAHPWLATRPIAHRGYHDAAAGRLENTLAAAEAAIARGFAIECDLQIGADDTVVVFHDHTLDRLTHSNGPVRALKRAELGAVRFRDADGAIPTLEALLDLIDGRVPLIVELKSHFDGDRRLERAAAAILASYHGPVAVMSFDPGSMIAMRRLAPALPRGILADRFRGVDWPQLATHKRLVGASMVMSAAIVPTFVAYRVDHLPASPPLALRHFFKLPLLAWTVRTQDHRATAEAWADQTIFEGFDPHAA